MGIRLEAAASLRAFTHNTSIPNCLAEVISLIYELARSPAALSRRVRFIASTAILNTNTLANPNDDEDEDVAQMERALAGGETTEPA